MRKQKPKFEIMTRSQFRKGLIEGRALAADAGVSGGFLLTGSIFDEVIKCERSLSVMRQLARVLKPLQDDVEEISVLTWESELNDAEWVTELGIGTDDVSSPFGSRLLTPHAISKLVKVSRKLLKAADAEQIIIESMSAVVTTGQEKAFIQGPGIGNPQGILSEASVPVYTTAVSGNVIGDDIRKWLFSLPNRYQANAKILTTVDFLRHALSLKSGDGEYLFPDYDGKLLNFPVFFSDGMPACVDTNDVLVAGSVVAIVGDFYQGYWIIDDASSLAVWRLSELYAASNEIGFQIWQETDGAVTAPDAFYVLKLKA
jgi:HK97 family phage major capsid protein